MWRFLGTDRRTASPPKALLYCSPNAVFAAIDAKAADRSRYTFLWAFANLTASIQFVPPRCPKMTKGTGPKPKRRWGYRLITETRSLIFSFVGSYPPLPHCRRLKPGILRTFPPGFRLGTPLILRRVYPEDSLTPLGETLGPIRKALCEWGKNDQKEAAPVSQSPVPGKKP